MIDKIDFFTPVIYGSHATNHLEIAAERVDGYFTFFEDKVAYVINDKRGPDGASDIVIKTAATASNIFLNIIKVISYYTIIIPLLMLALKALLRSQLNFHVIDEKDAPPVVAGTSHVGRGVLLGPPVSSFVRFFSALPSDIQKGVPSGSTEEVMQSHVREHAAHVKGALHLSQRHISDLPEEIRLFSNITSLDLHDNPLKTLPDLSPLTNLINLNVSNTQLKALPDISPLLGCLNISHTNISTLPEALLSCSELIVLKAASTGLEKLPSDIARLQELKLLDVAGNKISQLPDSLTDLKLDVLNISGNPIGALPAGFEKIATLRLLDISNTRITSLPDDFLRRFVIHKMMCDFEIDKRAFKTQWNRDFDELFPIESELVENTPDTLRATPIGALFIRNIVMNFDAYLQNGHFSKAI